LIQLLARQGAELNSGSPSLQRQGIAMCGGDVTKRQR